MAETEIKGLLLWGAELAELVPPVSPVGKTVGTLFAASIVAASLYLIRRQRRVEPRPGVPGSTLAAPGPWRRPVAWLMAGCGLLLLVGVWIDPHRHVNVFVLVWFLLLVAISVLLCAAGFDLMVVRRRAHQEWAALQRQQRRLEEEFKARQRS